MWLEIMKITDIDDDDDDDYKIYHRFIYCVDHICNIEVIEIFHRIDGSSDLKKDSLLIFLIIS